MTLPLPARVVDRDIARNFAFLAQRFPLEASTDNYREAPQVRAYHSVAKSIPNITPTILPFNSERYDLGTPSLNMHDTVTNNSRLICRVAGLYRMGVALAFAANAAGQRRADFLVNGITYIGGDSRPAVNGDTTAISIPNEYRLAVGDYVEVEVYQDSGGALNLNSGANYTPEFWMSWVSP